MRAAVRSNASAWLDTITFELRLAGRALRRAPGFTLITISTLALGLALTAVTLAIINAYLLRSLPFPAASRLYHVMYAPPGPVEPGGLSRLDWASLGDVVEYPVTATSETFYLTDDGITQTVRGLRVAPGFMLGLGVSAVVGRTFVSEDYAPGSERVALIGHGLWRERFGRDPGITRRRLRVEPERAGAAAETFRVVGVLPPDFWFGRDSRERVDVLVPLVESARTYMVRLQPGVPRRLAEARITEAARVVATSIPPDWPGVQLESAHDRYVAALRPILRSVFGAALLVLVVVCANVGVLLLLRALRRQAEFGLRVALGAGPARILRTLVAENSVLILAALAAGLLITRLGLHALAPVVEAQLGRPAPQGTTAIDLDLVVLLVVFSAGALIVIVLSAVPLLAPWRNRLADTLRAGGRGATDAPVMRRIRSALIAFELAGSLALLVCSGLLTRSAVNLLRTDLGFETAKVSRVRVVVPGRLAAEPASLAGVLERLLTSFDAPPDALMAFTEAWPPFIEKPAQPLEAAGVSAPATATFLSVGAAYFRTLGITLRSGRVFTERDRPGAEPVAIVSESLARGLWPDGSVLGRQVRAAEEPPGSSPLSEWRRVVGVVRDVRQTYGDEQLGDVYIPFLQAPARFAPLYVQSSQPPAAWFSALRSAAHRIDPYIVVHEPVSIRDEDRQRATTGFLTSMLGGFAAFAMFLAMLGVYGVTAYAAQQREREVAIRVAIGASRRSVVCLFIRDGAAVIGAGIGAGLIGAAVVGSLLEQQLHGVRPLDVGTFAVASLVLIAAGAAAVMQPARHIATRAPLRRLLDG